MALSKVSVNSDITAAAINALKTALKTELKRRGGEGSV